MRSEHSKRYLSLVVQQDKRIVFGEDYLVVIQLFSTVKNWLISDRKGIFRAKLLFDYLVCLFANCEGSIFSHITVATLRVQPS